MTLRQAAAIAGLSIGLMSGAAHAALITVPGLTSFQIGPGTYVITATGASGGGEQQGDFNGGHGAIVTGTFTFTSAETLEILVGGAAGGGGLGGGGGGGGTFVVGPGNQPLLVAGGGAGAGANGGNDAGPVVTVGGSGGQGFIGGGGGGFTGNGGDGEGDPFLGLTEGGQSYLMGGKGGSSYAGGDGGIGGGGAGGPLDTGGGGGGYTGGAGGRLGFSALGGYSFNAGSNQVFEIAATYGNGFVSIAAVPLPASAPLFGASLIALGAVGYAAKRKRAAATA